MRRKASAVWLGAGKDGKGHFSSGSGVFNNTQYSYHSRFEEGPGTNPEELIAAAHAGCFSMKLAFVLNAAGFTVEQIDTNCTVTLENGSITKSELDVKAKIPGISPEKFQECATEAKNECPISKSLTAEKTLTAELV